MTVLADLTAITPTANAKNVVVAKGTDISMLLTQAKRNAGELKVLMAQIIALHPVGGGDAANVTALNSVLTQLT